MNINELKINYLNNKKANNLFEIVLKENLEDIKVNQGEITIHTIFVEDNEDNIRASLVIINSSESQVNFKDMDLIFENKESEETVVISTNLRFLNLLPSMTITPFDIILDKNRFEGIEGEISKFEVAFNKAIRTQSSVIIDDFEADEDIRLEEKIEARMYLKSMELLKENIVAFKTFNPYINEEVLHIPIMIMNGYKNNRMVNEFLVHLIDGRGNTIDSIKIREIISIKSEYAKLILIKLSQKELKNNINLYSESIAIITE